MTLDTWFINSQLDIRLQNITQYRTTRDMCVKTVQYCILKLGHCSETKNSKGNWVFSRSTSSLHALLHLTTTLRFRNPNVSHELPKQWLLLAVTSRAPHLAFLHAYGQFVRLEEPQHSTWHIFFTVICLIRDERCAADPLEPGLLMGTA